MTTSRVAMTQDRSAAEPSTYAEAIGNGLAAKTARRSFGETIRATARSGRAMVGSTIRTLHLDGAASTLGDLSRWIVKRLARAGRFVKGFGFTNLAGMVLTTPLRSQALTVLSKVYRVVTYPVRLVGRALAWGLNKFGWGRKVVTKTVEYVQRAETFVARKAGDGVSWLAGHDNHGAMKWLRWYFQATIVRKGISMFFPRVPGWIVYAAGLAVPVYGDKVPAEEAAIDRAHEVLDKIPTPARRDVPAADVLVKETVVLTDASLPAGEQTFEAVSFIDDNGDRRIRMGSQLLLAEDLPDGIAIVGMIAGTGDQVQIVHPVEAQVRKAQASPSGRPPTLPRAAARTGQRGKAKPAGTRGR
jgi:hypothetical protein